MEGVEVTMPGNFVGALVLVLGGLLSALCSCNREIPCNTGKLLFLTHSRLLSNSPTPGSLIHHLSKYHAWEWCFRAYLSSSSKLDEEKLGLLCFRRI